MGSGTGVLNMPFAVKAAGWKNAFDENVFYPVSKVGRAAPGWQP